MEGRPIVRLLGILFVEFDYRNIPIRRISSIAEKPLDRLNFGLLLTRRNLSRMSRDKIIELQTLNVKSEIKIFCISLLLLRLVVAKIRLTQVVFIKAVNQNIVQ